MTWLAPRRAALVASLLVPVLMVACASGSGPAAPSVEPGSPSVTPSPAASGDPRLPEGTYRTADLTREQMVAAGSKAGLSRATVEEALARDGIRRTAAFALKIEGGRWTQFYSYDGSAEASGFRATYEVVDDETVVTTEECCGRTTFTYVVAGDALRIRWAKDDHHPDPEACRASPDCAVGLLVWQSAPFRRV